LAVFEQIIDTTLKRRREREKGVMSLFGDWGDDDTGSDGVAVEGFDERTDPRSSSTRPNSSATRRRCSGCTCPTIHCSASRRR
jgi:hypothetical protein